MSNIRSLNDYPGYGKNRNGYAPFGQPGQSGSSPPIIQTGYTMDPNGTVRRLTWMEAIFPEFKYKSFLFVVSVIDIIIFIINVAWAFWKEKLNPYSYDATYSCFLYYAGGGYTPAITTYYQVYRLFNPIFLHGGIGHVFWNVIGQCRLGFILEKDIGTKNFAAFYILTGIGGNLLSSIILTEDLAIGASTSGFGIIALWLAYLYENRERYGTGAWINAIWIILSIINQVAHSAEENVDNYGHLGGFITGALLAICLIQRENNAKWRRIQKGAQVVCVLFFVVTSVILANLPDLSYLAYQRSMHCQPLISN